MGEQALKLFEEARKMGGLVGTMKLASMARVTSSEAASMEDSSEVIGRLEKAVAQLKGEELKRASTKVEGVATAASTPEQMRNVRKHVQAYVELMSQRGLMLNDVNATIRRIVETASSVLDIERVSVWWVDPKRTKITCADLWERKPRKHSSGTELFAKDFAPYFDALNEERTIAAHDAHKDPRTSCFSQVYLAPLGINSMLDVPIWVKDKMVGVVCHEHIGRARRWDGDEENFAYLMSNFVALALERSTVVR